MTEKAKRTLVLAAAIVLLCAAAAALFWGFGHRSRALAAENRLESLYEKSFDELRVHVGEVEANLSKALVVSSPRQAALYLSAVWRTAGEAATVLGQLPAAFSRGAQTNRFLVQASDYSHTLLKKVTAGTPLSSEDIAQLSELHNACAALSSRLRELSEDPARAAWIDGDFDYYAVEASAGEAASGTDTAAQNPGTDSGEAGNSAYPHLIYDGPFSESTEKAQPLGLPAGEYSRDKAREQAKAFLSGELSGELTDDGESLGRIPCWSFAGRAADGRTLSIDVTKTGGACLSYRKSAVDFSAREKPDEETGRALSEAGKAFLAARGFSSMESTYAQYYGGCAVINYAAVQQGALLYSDLIKLWVEIDSGAVVGFEASGYWMSHVSRSLPAPQLSAAEAQELLSPALSVQSVRLALIPLSLTDERLCYEFKCTYGGDSFILYLSALTGEEEEVFQIIDSENGQLVL